MAELWMVIYVNRIHRKDFSVSIKKHKSRKITRESRKEALPWWRRSALRRRLHRLLLSEPDHPISPPTRPCVFSLRLPVSSKSLTHPAAVIRSWTLPKPGASLRSLRPKPVLRCWCSFRGRERCPLPSRNRRWVRHARSASFSPNSHCIIIGSLRASFSINLKNNFLGSRWHKIIFVSGLWCDCLTHKLRRGKLVNDWRNYKLIDYVMHTSLQMHCAPVCDSLCGGQHLTCVMARTGFLCDRHGSFDTYLS